MDKRDFDEYLNHWSSHPNPSNQNFHNKMIRSLSINNKVDVISARPFSKTLCDIKGLKKSEKEDGNITWHYISIQRNFFKKIINGTKQVTALVKKFATDDSIIFVDTINSSIAHYTKHAMKRRNNKIIGICTDSPSNISGTSRSYTMYLLSHANNYSGYIALTAGLNELFNTNNRPHLILEGLVEQNLVVKNTQYENYFFFGGALLPRYGIYDLIKAFKIFNKEQKYKLVFSGHHSNDKALKEEIGDDNNIIYLGAITISDCLSLEKGAIANINPRPFSEDLDRYSVPSKTLEYLTSGVPTISVKNSKLQKTVGDYVIWSKSSSEKDLVKVLEHVVSLTESERQKLGEDAKQQVLELYSLKSTNSKINKFLEELQ